MTRLWLLLLIPLAGCGGPITPPEVPNPQPPPAYDYSIVVTDAATGVFIQGAGFSLDAVPKGTTNAYGFAETTAPTGVHQVSVTAAGYASATYAIDLTRHTRKAVRLDPVAPPITPLSASGLTFLRGSTPWRWKGVTAFKLARLHADGANIQPFLDAYKGFNVLRIFDYVPWPGTGWQSPTPAQTLSFLQYVGARGWYVEVVLLTDDDPARIAPAKALVEALVAAHLSNVVIEIGNEPNTNKHIDTSVLRTTLDASGFLYSSGDYDDSPKFFGRFGTYHSARDSEWPRKAHDALEYWNGGGPNAPTDPAHKVPWVADEPIRPDQAGQPPVLGRREDFLAYFATASLLGAGGTFHSATGRFGDLPTADEATMAAAALEGLNKFPADAPISGSYQRIDEQGATLRTYRVGPHTVRIRPTDGVIFP